LSTALKNVSKNGEFKSEKKCLRRSIRAAEGLKIGSRGQKRAF